MAVSALSVTADNSLGDPAGGLFFGGGTMLNGGSSTFSSNRAITLNTGGGTLDTGASTTNISTFNGNVANGANLLTLQGSGDGIYNGIIGNGSGGLAKLGTGTWTLNAANTFSGNTSVGGGTLDLTNANALQNSTVATGGTGIMFDSSVASHAFTFGGLGGSGNLALLGTPIIESRRSQVAVALSADRNNNTSTTFYSGVLQKWRRPVFALDQDRHWHPDFRRSQHLHRQYHPQWRRSQCWWGGKRQCVRSSGQTTGQCRRHHHLQRRHAAILRSSTNSTIPVASPPPRSRSASILTAKM